MAFKYLRLHSKGVYKRIIVYTFEWVATFSPYHPSIWGTTILHEIIMTQSLREQIMISVKYLAQCHDCMQHVPSPLIISSITLQRTWMCHLSPTPRDKNAQLNGSATTFLMSSPLPQFWSVISPPAKSIVTVMKKKPHMYSETRMIFPRHISLVYVR